MQTTVYLENQEYIALCDLLKLAGLAESGGHAKALIAAGQVQRNGVTETRKTAKFVKNFMDGQTSIQAAVEAYVREVKAGTFPSAEHTFE